LAGDVASSGATLLAMVASICANRHDRQQGPPHKDLQVVTEMA
jgi:hypothetical protein